MPLLGQRRLSRGPMAGHNPSSDRNRPRAEGSEVLRLLVRRLLPVIAFALVLCLVLTGLLRHSRSQLSMTGHSQTSQRPASTGVSSAVGGIPGAGSPATRYRPYTLTVAAKPLPASAHASVPKLVRLLQADALVVDAGTLPA